VINRPWWKSYDEGVRSQLTYPEVCVHNLLQKIAFSKGSSTAIEIDQDRITYGELDRVSTNFARNLISLGVLARVYGLEVVPSAMVAFLACLLAGYIIFERKGAAAG